MTIGTRILFRNETDPRIRLEFHNYLAVPFRVQDSEENEYWYEDLEDAINQFDTINQFETLEPKQSPEPALDLDNPPEEPQTNTDNNHQMTDQSIPDSDLDLSSADYEVHTILAKELYLLKEQVLFRAIAMALDPHPPGLLDLQGRLHVTRRQDGSEVWTLDNKPLVLFGPPTTQEDNKLIVPVQHLWKTVSATEAPAKLYLLDKEILPARPKARWQHARPVVAFLGKFLVAAIVYLALCLGLAWYTLLP